MSRSAAVEEVLQALRGQQVPDISADLPIPLTTRNLQPRAASRSSGSASGSRPPSRASGSRRSGGSSLSMHENSTQPGTSQNFYAREEQMNLPARAIPYDEYNPHMYYDDYSRDIDTLDAYNSASWPDFESWDGGFHRQNDTENDLYNPTQSLGSWDNSTTGMHPAASSSGPSGSKRKRSPSPDQYGAGASYISQRTDSDAEVADHLIDGGDLSQAKVDRKGKGKAREETTAIEIPDSPSPATKEPKKSEPEPLSEYTCPICFGPPMNATLTPCGHISCGSCLFAAVKSTLQRAIVTVPGVNEARCPVCRATIPGWDGKGAGVIGLKPRAIFRL